MDKQLIDDIVKNKLKKYQNEPDPEELFCLEADVDSKWEYSKEEERRYIIRWMCINLQILTLPTNVEEMELKYWATLKARSKDKEDEKWKEDLKKSGTLSFGSYPSRSVNFEISFDDLKTMSTCTLDMDIKITTSYNKDEQELHWKWRPDENKLVEDAKKYCEMEKRFGDDGSGLVMKYGQKKFDLDLWLKETKRVYTSCEVYTFLEDIGCEQYNAAFIKNGLRDAAIVASLDLNDLKEIGIDKLGDRKKILSQTKQIKNGRYKRDRGYSY